MSRPLDSFFLWLLQVLLLSLLLLFFLWLSLRPSPPSYEIIDFSVDTNDSSISFSVEFSNNNRGGSVYYDNITVTVYTGDNESVVVGVVILPSFGQGHEKSTVVPGKVKGSARGRLKVEMAATVRYRVWWWRSKVQGVDVEAGVKVGRDGKVSAKEKKKKIKMCRVKMKKKKRSKKRMLTLL